MALLMLTSCGSDSQSASPGVGSLSVALSVRQHLYAPDGSRLETLIPVIPESASTSLTVSDATGAYSHTWSSFDSFPQGEDYFTGDYSVSARWGTPQAEGFDNPSFEGSEMVHISEGEHTLSTVILEMMNSAVRVDFGSTAHGSRTLLSIDFVSPSGMRHTFRPGEERMLCLVAGESEIYATLGVNGEDTPLCLSIGHTGLLKPSTLYSLEASLDDGRLTVYGSGIDYSMSLDRLESLATPTLTGSSLLESVITLPEGESPSSPCTVSVAPGSSPLSRLCLSTSSASLTLYPGFPANADLLHLSDSEREAFAALGFSPEITPEGGTIDLEPLMEKLIFLEDQSPLTVFNIIAIGSDGLASAPLEIRVETTPVDIVIADPKPTVMGIDRTTLRVECPALNFARHIAVRITEADQTERTLVPLTVEKVSAGVYDVSFPIGAGSTPVEAGIYYCDELRRTLTIERIMPSFSIAVDAFAREAAIKINSDDPALTEIITDRLYIYVNGKETPVYERWLSEGILHVIGLEPSSTYRFESTMMAPGTPGITFTPAVSATTEGTPQLPNADFEERTNGVIYPGLPSGGRYSQTTVEIFNWQHHTTYEQEVPEGWANTNAKTFCTKASNHNTWYMQPSVSLTRTDPVSGSFVAELTTVAFDLKGEPIPDYAQTSQPYLDYSPIVPHIACRAAGKLFLGGYSFNPATMEETYREGISFGSRPRSLNGFYRFMPSQANRSAAGLVKVEVLNKADGRETVIAEGSVRLTLASDNTAFSVPLTYNMFGVKATMIKVMFSSSDHIGTIAEETAAIQTFPDPQTATSTGGRLWIDNISLAY